MIIKNVCERVKIYSHETQQFKTASIRINLVTDIDDSVSAKSLLMHLLVRTNNNFPSIYQMNRKLASLYGASISVGVDKIGDAQVLGLKLNSIDDRFTLTNEKISGECVNLLFDCIFNPQLVDGEFTAENLEREKRLLCEKIEAEKDEKRIYASNRMIEEMYKDEKYGMNILGDVEEIKNLSVDDVKKAWVQVLATAKIQINVVGSADVENIAKVALRYLDKYEYNNKSEIFTEFTSCVNDVKRIEETQNVKQGKLVLGFRTQMKNSKDNFAAMKVMNAVFGSGTFSKLFVNVREKMSLCYYCSSVLRQNKGFVMVQSGVETENMQKALDAILNELDEVKKGNFTDDVITSAKLSLAEMLTSTMDSVSSIDIWCTTQILENDFVSCEELLAQIQKVTREQIIDAANTLTLDTVYILKSEVSENE